MNKTNIKNILYITIIVSIIGYTLLWFAVLRYNISTDNAYVKSTIVNVAPRVTGIISEVFVKNNQHVKKGQPLYLIDQTIYKLALQQAQANLKIKQALLDQAQSDFRRTSILYQRHTASQASYDDSVASLKNATSSLELAQEQLQDSRNNLSYTTVSSPIDGTVSNFTLGVGDPVQAYRPSFSLISDDFWIDANFKETDIEPIKIGNCVAVELDMYPGKKIKGYVESISNGTGDVFSLLPSENATGNWVKVTRRLTVHIHIPQNPPKITLRAGASAVVTIYTRQKCLP